MGRGRREKGDEWGGSEGWMERKREGRGVEDKLEKRSELQVRVRGC